VQKSPDTPATIHPGKPLSATPQNAQYTKFSPFLHSFFKKIARLEPTEKTKIKNKSVVSFLGLRLCRAGPFLPKYLLTRSPRPIKLAALYC
jgi:hypothetical protein